MLAGCVKYRTGLVCFVLGLGAGGWGVWQATSRTTLHEPVSAAEAAEPSPAGDSAIPAAEPDRSLIGRLRSAALSRKGRAAPVLHRVANPVPVDQAIARLNERVKQAPHDPAAWAELGEALMQKARETADAGYYGHAEKAYAKALEADPKSVAATVGRAWVHGGRHEFEQSIEWTRKALALDAENPRAYGLLGDAAVELGDYDAAHDHYQKMIDLRPDLASYSRGAHLLYLTGNATKAALWMQQTISAGGPYTENAAWCRAELALLYFGTGNLVAAEQVLQEAVRQAPNNLHILAALGKVAAARKDYAAAIEHHKKAAAIAPVHDVGVALGDLYQLTGKTDEAEKQYALVETMHRLNKANGVRGDSQLARFYADHDRNLPEALRLAEEEYRTRKNVFVADTLGWCYYKNGRYAEAKQAIQKARSRNTPEATILFHAGMIYAKLGERSAAQRCLYQAVSLNPHFSPVHASVATDLLQQLGSQPPETNTNTPAGEP